MELDGVNRCPLTLKKERGQYPAILTEQAGSIKFYYMAFGEIFLSKCFATVCKTYGKRYLKPGFPLRRSRSRKSAYDLVKIKYRSRKRSHISSSESDSEESERSHFLLTALMTPSLMIQ